MLGQQPKAAAMALQAAYSNRDELEVSLKELEGSVAYLISMTIALGFVMLFFFAVQSIAVIIQIIRRCSRKDIRKELLASKKASKRSKRSKSKKKRSKKSRSKSKGSSTKESTKASSKTTSQSASKSSVKPKASTKDETKKSSTKTAKPGASSKPVKPSGEVASKSREPLVASKEPVKSDAAREKRQVPTHSNLSRSGEVVRQPEHPSADAFKFPKSENSQQGRGPSAEDYRQFNEQREVIQALPPKAASEGIGRTGADVPTPPPMASSPKGMNDSLMLPVCKDLTPIANPDGTATSPRQVSSKEAAFMLNYLAKSGYVIKPPSPTGARLAAAVALTGSTPPQTGDVSSTTVTPTQGVEFGSPVNASPRKAKSPGAAAGIAPQALSQAAPVVESPPPVQAPVPVATAKNPNVPFVQSTDVTTARTVSPSQPPVVQDAGATAAPPAQPMTAPEGQPPPTTVVPEASASAGHVVIDIPKE